MHRFPVITEHRAPSHGKPLVLWHDVFDGIPARFGRLIAIVILEAFQQISTYPETVYVSLLQLSFEFVVNREAITVAQPGESTLRSVNGLLAPTL